MALVETDQDFSTYTVTDANFRITTFTADECGYTNLDRTDNVIVAQSKGAGGVDPHNFNPSCLHKTTMSQTSSFVMVMGCHAIYANHVNQPGHSRVTLTNNPSLNSRDRFSFAGQRNAEATQSDLSALYPINTERLIKWSSVGNVFTCIIYQGSVVGPILETLTFTSTGTIPDVEYLYGPTSRQSGVSHKISGYTRTFKAFLEGVAASISPQFFQRGR